MMLTGGAIGTLELRAARDGSRRLSGSFPYNSRAVLSDGGRTGRPRKEAFAPGAFAYRIDNPDEEIHLLIGHDYDRPLASREAGTFFVSDKPDAVSFQAIITAELQRATYVQDFFAGFAAGLILPYRRVFGYRPSVSCRRPKRQPKRTLPKASPLSERSSRRCCSSLAWSLCQPKNKPMSKNVPA